MNGDEPFLRTIGCCRLVYNLCLDQKKLERERSGPRKVSQFDQIKELTALKAEFDFLRTPRKLTSRPCALGRSVCDRFQLNIAVRVDCGSWSRFWAHAT